jgi:hypothetical protein
LTPGQGVGPADRAVGQRLPFGLRSSGRSLRVCRDMALARSFLWPLIRERGAHCAGRLCEVFDEDPPFALGGCIAHRRSGPRCRTIGTATPQAWRAAEVLRVWKETAIPNELLRPLRTTADWCMVTFRPSPSKGKCSPYSSSGCWARNEK